MVNQLDTSALDPGGFKTVRDLRAANTLVDQKIQAGNVANAEEQSKYLAQVLTGAVASGQQSVYDGAKAHLGQMGIDVSGLAPDIQTGAQQVTALRQAQYNANPLNSLLGLGLHAEGNLNSATSALGSTGAAAAADPLSAQIADRMRNMTPPGGVPAPGGVRQPTPAQQVQQSGAVQPVTVAQLDGVQAPQGVAPPSPTPAPAAAPQGAPAAMPPALPASNLQSGAIDTNGSTSTQFVAPQPVPGETAAVTQNRVENAFNAWKANPAVQSAQKKAETIGGAEGDQVGDVSKAINVMVSNVPAVMSRFQQLRRDAPQASSGMGVDNEGNGWSVGLSNILGTKTADANANMKQLTAQGIFPEINSALGQSGTKGNKFLETIINNASGIQMDAPGSSKLSQIDNNQNMFVMNLKAAAQHARDLGQTAPSDQEIDGMVQEALAKPLPAANSIKPVSMATPQTIAKIPSAAVSALQADPSKAADFDKWYGAGAAQQLLGNK